MKRKPAVHEVSHPSAPDDFWLGRAVKERLRRGDQTHGSVFAYRSDARKQIPLEALVNYGLTYSVPWHIRDLSPTGAFVEMDPADFSEGAYVEFVLRFQYKGKPIEHRLPGKVTRIEPNGIPLRFGNYDDESYTDLINLLYAM